MSQTLLQKMGFSDPDKKCALHDDCVSYLSQPEKLKQISCSCMKEIWGDYIEDMKDIEICECKTELPIIKGEGKYRTTIGFVDIWFTAEVFFTIPLDKIIPIHKTHEHRFELFFKTPHDYICCGVIEEDTKMVTVEQAVSTGRIKEMMMRIKEKNEGEKTQEVAKKETEHVTREVYSGKPKPFGEQYKFGYPNIIIEVKTSYGNGFGDILRQCSIYKEFHNLIDPNAKYDKNLRILILATLFQISESEKSRLKESNIVWVYVDPDKLKKWVENERPGEPDIAL